MFDILNALLLGFTYGIGACTIACAPLIVPLIMSVTKNKKEGVILSLIFSFGRVISYITLGFLSALVTQEFDLFISKKLLGVFFVILGLLIFFKVHGKCIYKSKLKLTGPFITLFSGIVYGLGPCPPLIALLAMTAATHSPFTGAAMGLVFGIGTILSPIIVLGFLSGWFASKKEFKEVIPYVSGGFIIILGIIYIISGFL